MASFQDYRGSVFMPWLLPIIPVGAKLTDGSLITPDKIGKIPGWYHGPQAGWSGLGGWNGKGAANVKALQLWDSWFAPRPPIIGLRASRFPGFDLDTEEGWQTEIAQDIAFNTCGKTIARARSDGSPRRLLMYRLDQDRSLPIFKYRRVFDPAGDKPFAIEILGEGQQYLIGGPHAKGGEYVWTDGQTPLSYGFENIPKITIDQVQEFVTELSEAYGLIGVRPAKINRMRGGDVGTGEGALPIDENHPQRAPSDSELTIALGYLSVLDEEFADYDAWERISRAVKTACCGSETFYNIVYEPWQKANPENDDHIRAKWESHTDSQIGWDYIVSLACRNGFIPSGAGLFEALGPDDAAVDDTGPRVGSGDAQGDPLSREPSAPTTPPANGSEGPKRPPDQERFLADQWVGDVARKEWMLVPYSGTSARWKHFEDGRWADASVGPGWELGGRAQIVSDLIRANPGATKEDLTRARWLVSNNAATALAALAKSHPRIRVPRQQLDAHSWIMGVPGGHVDRQGRLCDPDPSLFITRQAGCAPAPGECPRWESLVMSLANNDVERYVCLRAALGYTMTGTGRETKFFFLHGEEGNEGKSSFLRCLALVMGEYSTVLPDGAFVANRNGDNNKFAFGGLEGAWFAYNNEIEGEQVWAMAGLKDKTSASTTWVERKGVDGIVIPIKYGLWFQGNLLPRFPKPDPALRKRLVIFNCEMPIAKEDEEQDWALTTFALEGPQILAWLLRARADYEKNGLQIPTSMQESAAEYLADQDQLGQMITTCLTLDPHARIASQELFDFWRVWGENQNVHPSKLGTTASFTQALLHHEIIRKWIKQGKVSRATVGHTQRSRCLVGLKLCAPDQEPEASQL